MSVAMPKNQTAAGVAATVTPNATANALGGKSGLIVLNAGQVLFNENDAASSLFIIQKGQIRLYKPKGKGFIELAVLRVGEVIGEMAYFAEEENEKKRSCSAQALIRTEIIEISFNAFSKTMANLNPWFKTIINTLASRLRKTNAKVKELETNSVSVGYGSSSVGYKFFRSIDIVKLLCTLYLVVKSHGEVNNSGFDIHKRTLSLYAFDIYNIQESKFEEFINVLKNLGLIDIVMDKDNLPNMYRVFNLDAIKSLFGFFNTQRVTQDDKQIKISSKGEIVLGQILAQFQSKGIKTPKAVANLSPIFNSFKEKNINITIDDLDEAKKSQLVGDVIVGNDGQLSCEVNYETLKTVYPSIRLMNAISKVNELKSAGK